VDVTIPSDPSAIAAVRRSVEDLAVGIGLDERAVGDVGLCVNEALANVMRHAYGGAADRPILVRAWCEDEALVVTIRDWGNGVNPASLPPKPYNPCEPGGLGLICLQRMMSTVSYVPQGDGGMLLVMTKRKQRKQGQAKESECCKQAASPRAAAPGRAGVRENRSERGQ
jgi:anti-sigma regulatory factor (Ser/Thr protein kinase)